MKSLKKSFFELITSYKSLPYTDIHDIFDKKDGKYRVKLIIEKLYTSHKKPTHKTVKAIVQYMKKYKDIHWMRCDDPANDPPLYCFSNLDEKNFKFCSISLQDLRDSKLTANQVLSEVNKKE